MTQRVLVPLAAGFEEIEAVTIIDVLRRAEVDVTSAALDELEVKGSRGIHVVADARLDSLDLDSFDAIVLPGGMGGTLRMLESSELLSALGRQRQAGRLTAAICAAPLVFERAGIVDGVPITSHPSVQDQLERGQVRAEQRVVREGSVLTSQGPGTALEFALAVVAELCGANKSSELAQAMVVAPEPA